MSAPTYTAADLADAFGDNYGSTLDKAERGPWIPINALWSIAKEIGILATVVEEVDTVDDWAMHLLWLGRRMETAAAIGAGEVGALQDRIKELEAKLELYQVRESEP